MIIDIHTHTFPEILAKRALNTLSESACIPYCSEGTNSSLLQDSIVNNIDYSVVLPVATKEGQHENINRIAAEINSCHEKDGLISFGTLHPDDKNYKSVIDRLCAAQIKGIKLHPVFQHTDADDVRYLRILEYAYERNLAVIIHAGIDISWPGDMSASVSKIRHMLREVTPQKLILAHMGGWGQWEECFDGIYGTPGVYLDTAFCSMDYEGVSRLSPDTFREIIKAHGEERILFGTDSPWDDRSHAISKIQSLGLPPKVCGKILGDNAFKLLFPDQTPCD